MAQAKRDENRVPSLIGVSSADGITTIPVYADAATNRLLVSGVGGGGTSAVDDAAFVAGSGAGTPAMGFATSDTVDAGDVGVLAMDTSRNLKVAVQSGGGGTQYDIQDVAGGTDTGDIALVQRNDTLADLSGGDGAYAPLQVDATGALYIQEGVAMDVSAATVTVDATNLDIRDLTEASDGVEIYGSDDGGTTQTVIKTDAGGAIQVDVESGTITTVTTLTGITNDVSIDDGGNTITVDGTVTSTPSGVQEIEGDEAEGAALPNPVLIGGDDGTDIKNVNVDATTGDVQVDLTAGTATIGEVTIGAATGAAGDLAKIEDAQHATGDVGVMALGVENEDGAALSGGDKDYTPIAVTTEGNVIVKQEGALNGAADPAVDSYAHIAINLNAGADQVLVSSAASKQIWVYGVAFTCSVAGTVSFQDEDNTAVTGIMDFAANSGMATPPSGNFAMPIWKLATDKDLEVDIVSAALDGWLSYAIMSV